MITTAIDALESIWSDNGLSGDSLAYVSLPDSKPVLPSSFHVGVAAQTSIGAAALAAAEIWYQRTGQRQRVNVDMHDSEYECTGCFTIDSSMPEVWAKFSGLYSCGECYVRIHANFDHHRDGILKIFGLPAGDVTERDEVVVALSKWDAEEFETVASEAGLVVSKVRSFDAWDKHPQAQALAKLPLLYIDNIGDGDAQAFSKLSGGAQPLAGIRVLDLTRILAGPTCGRVLAAYGADVMLVNSPNLPNIEHIIDTSRGKLSALIDLETEKGCSDLHNLLSEADVIVQGYRPGGLERFGFGAEQLAEKYPGLIYVSLSAYSHAGPWAARRGFDSLVQAATGFNCAEAEAYSNEYPKALPVQILDYATGFFMAYAAQAALLRRASEGGSWHVRVSLAQTAQWLRGLGRIDFDHHAAAINYASHLKTYVSDYGELKSMPHAAKFATIRVDQGRASVPPGTHEPVWPD